MTSPPPQQSPPGSEIRHRHAHHDMAAAAAAGEADAEGGGDGSSGRRDVVLRQHLSMEGADDTDATEPESAAESSSESSDAFIVDEAIADNEQQQEHEQHHSLPTPEDLAARQRSGAAQSHAHAHHRQQETTAMQTIAGVAGNVLEWYDFAVFGYFGDIIGDVFFPPQAGHAAIVESFAVFGGAFMMRPVGGMMMGYIGDKFGRKRALEISIFLMAFPTFAMGCLPSYERIGPMAVVLLTLIRCLQGLSVGGQLMSSLVFTLEKHPREKWGLYGSYVMAAANVGTLLGGIVGFVMRATLTLDQLRTWGWRVPFLAGILVSLSGVYLKFHCEESQMTHHDGSHPGETSPNTNPIKVAFSRGNRRSLLSATLVPMLWSAGFYLTFVWLAVFMSDLEVPPVPNAFAVNSASLLFSVCIVFPLGGILSDMYGRKRIMILGGASMGILSPVMILIIGMGNPLAAFFAQSTMGIALTLWGAPMMAWLVEGFPPAARLTSVAIGYNLAQATAGGFTPAIATIVVDKFGGNAPGFILSVLALLSVTGLLIAPPHEDGAGSLQHDSEAADEEERVHFSYATNDEEGGEDQISSGREIS